MASELAVEVKFDIGGAIDSSLGEVFGQVQQRIVQLETYGKRIGTVLQSTTQETLNLAGRYQTTVQLASKYADEWLRKLEGITGGLKAQHELLPKLTKAYEDLGKATRAVSLSGGAGQLKGLSMPDAAGTVLDASDTVLKKARGPLEADARYKAIIQDVVVNGVADPGQRASVTRNLIQATKEMAAASGMGQTEAAELLLQMFSAGSDIPTLLQDGVVAAEYTRGQKVDGDKTAALIRAIHVNKAGEVREALNGIIEIAKKGSATSDDLSQRLPRVLPLLKGEAGLEKTLRAAAIVQSAADSPGTVHQAMALAEDTAREYPSQEGEEKDQARTEAKYGQGYMPTPSEKEKPRDFIAIDLRDRRDSSEYKESEKKAAEERVIVGIGGGLALINDTWNDIYADAANLLGAFVENFKATITGLGALVLGSAAVVKSFGMIGKAGLLLDATKALFAPEDGPLEGGKGGQGAKDGLKSRTKLAASRLLGETAESAGTSIVMRAATGALRWGVPGFSMYRAADTALDTYRSETTFKGKAEGYGQAAGMAIGTVLGGVGGGFLGSFFGPGFGTAAGAAIGSLALGELFGFAGKKIGGWIGDTWGDSAQASEKPDSAKIDPTGSLSTDPAALAAFTVPSGNQQVSVAAASPQTFAVSPNIVINVQGSITNPAELVSVLRPEIQSMFNGLAAQANTGAHVWDNAAVEFIA